MLKRLSLPLPTGGCQILDGWIVVYATVIDPRRMSVTAVGQKFVLSVQLFTRTRTVITTVQTGTLCKMYFVAELKEEP